MRFVLSILLAVSASATAPAADDKAAAETVRAINTVCPVTGKKIDPKIAPETVQLKKPATAIAVGLCSEACRATVAKDPEKHANAAIANKKAP
jgi:hypothetical protein